MKASALAAVVIAVVFCGLGWWLRTYHHTSGAVLIALGAFAVSCFAQFQASRSVHIAAKNEKRLRYGWASRSGSVRSPQHRNASGSWCDVTLPCLVPIMGDIVRQRISPCSMDNVQS